MLLVTADQMRNMDRRTIQHIGIAGIVLMERAALGAVEVLIAHFELDHPTRIGILCGGGNNGGDGFAMARMLTERGHQVWVGAMKAPGSYSGDAAQNLAVLEALDIDVHDLSDVGDELNSELDQVEPCTVWVDAVFGTGLDRDVEGMYEAALRWLSTHPRIFAVDIPSGLDATTGAVLNVAVAASATATFGLPKLGMALYPARAICGEIYTIDIGIPANVVSSVGWAAEWLIEPPELGYRYAVHKGQAGRVVAIGGEAGKTGAILMAARAALRSGAGLVTVGTYADSLPQVAPSVPEAMGAEVLARTIEQKHADALDEFLESADVVAIGPGMGTHDGAFEVLDAVLESEMRVVVDADGLNLMAHHRMQLQHIDVETLVLTPHPGEAARLCGCTVADVLADPIGRALEIARDWDACVVLKGQSTVIADPSGRIAISDAGNRGMATAGMGDALTGILAAHLCESTRFETICAAVWVHGTAGDRAAETRGVRGLTTSALLDELPYVWSELEDG